MATTIGSPSSTSAGWPHVLAILTSGTTVILILAGGLVTSLGAGLAVPDWPTTFGYNMFLFPWAKMVGGIFYEHSHRLLGSLVGILTILTAAALWRGESRRWVSWLGAAAIGLVIVQGILGGLRVVWLKLLFAIFHACVAQLFFALMVSLAVFTSKSWINDSDESGDMGRKVRRMCLVTVGLIYVQTIFGAVLRHTGNRLDAHLLVAVLVAIHVFWLAALILRGPSGQGDTRRPANMLWLLLIVQLGLGAGSYLGKYTAIGDAITPWTIAVLTSGHVVAGALLFATSIVLALRLHRTRIYQWAASRRAPLSGQVSTP